MTTSKDNKEESLEGEVIGWGVTEPAPKWTIEKVKYNSLRQVILARNDWEQKYPLLEKLVDGIISEALSSYRTRLVKSLPEERIVHEYMKTQGEGKSTEYCNGWNDYRNATILLLDRDKEI